MRDGGRVTGITTAAMIWLVAALGMGVGGGYYLFSLLATGVILIVLIVFPVFEGWIDRMRDVRTYEVFCPLIPDRFEEIEALFADCGLHIRNRKRLKADEEMICIWHAYGRPQEHARMMEKLFAHPDVRRFKT
jgi:putative Mg2+ transporter-C (MgtC) family protein